MEDKVVKVELKLETIDKIFAEAKHQQDYLMGLYRTVFADFDKIAKLNGYPSISEPTVNYIWEKAIAFDKRVHPDVLAGGLWMNNGFSSEKAMEDWVAVYNSNIIIYKE